MRKTKLVFVVLAIVLALGLFVTACTNTAEVAGEETEKTEQSEDTKIEEIEKEALEEGPETLRMATFWIPDNADPALKWNGWLLARFGAGEGLVQFDENHEMKNVIAESWEQIDEKTLKFIIRDGITFSNGNPVDAAACKASIERVINITERTDILLPIDEILADGQELIIKTSDPLPIAVNILADPLYIIVDASAEASDADFAMHPVTTAPYTITEFVAGESIKLEKNETYWQGDIDVEFIEVQYYPDATARAMALQAGEVDFASNLNPIDVQLFESDEYTVHAGANLRTEMIVFNHEKSYLKELDFRKALSYAMDKKAYAEDLLGYEYTVGPFNENLDFAYKGDEYYGFDQAKAKELLDGLGYTDSDGDGVREINGKNIVLEIGVDSSGGDENTLAVAIQAQLKEVGIGTDIKQYENLSDMRKTGEYDMYFTAWVSAPTGDPESLLEQAFHSSSDTNYGKYNNEKFDEVCDSFSTAFTKEDRNKIGIEATEVLLEDVGTIFLYHKVGVVITKSNVGGVYRFMSDIHNIDERLTMNE